MTVYVVTGRYRTGTSMMIRALSLSSGIEILHDSSIDDQLDRVTNDISTYHPNPNGYFQPPTSLRLHDAQGKLVKASTRGGCAWMLADLSDYLVVHMRRPEVERVASWNRAFTHGEFNGFAEMYEEGEAILAARTDCRVEEVSYHDVVRDPLAVFERLASRGWPIDPVVAAETVDPSLHRNR